LPQNRYSLHLNPASLKLFGRNEALFTSCNIWGEICWKSCLCRHNRSFKISGLLVWYAFTPFIM
jgi:hypothetical protein